MTILKTSHILLLLLCFLRASQASAKDRVLYHYYNYSVIQPDDGHTTCSNEPYSQVERAFENVNVTGGLYTSFGAPTIFNQFCVASTITGFVMAGWAVTVPIVRLLNISPALDAIFTSQPLFTMIVNRLRNASFAWMFRAAVGFITEPASAIESVSRISLTNYLDFVFKSDFLIFHLFRTIFESLFMIIGWSTYLIIYQWRSNGLSVAAPRSMAGILQSASDYYSDWGQELPSADWLRDLVAQMQQEENAV